jgi:hypothetical protein
MKNSRKKTKVPFHLASNDDHFLFGIVSNEPDYKLSLLINNELHISLKNNAPVETEDDSGRLVSYSKFTDNKGSPHISYNLISNRSGNNILLKKLKSYDYFFLIQDTEDDSDPSFLTKKLKESGLFRVVFLIDLKEVNDKYLQYLIP